MEYVASVSASSYPHRNLLNLIGFLTWVVVAFPVLLNLLQDPTPLGGRRLRAWAATFLVFTVAYAFTTWSRNRAVVLAMLGVQAFAALAMARLQVSP